jgi:prepilin-type N-terminal cleavage/methylation domain-containing protein
MIHFKSHKRGFTLIEVMFAVMIMGIALTPISLIYSLVVRRVSSSSRSYNLLLLCKNFLQEAHQKQEWNAQTFSLEKKEVDFDVTLTYSLEKGVDQKSSLLSVQNLHREVVTISWKEDGRPHQEQLVAFVYKKPEQKK